MKEYSELRRLAEAATKCYGAMRVEKDYNGVYQVVGAGSWKILSAWHTPDGKSKDNAEFHAAASPDAVLALIAEVDRLSFREEMLSEYGCEYCAGSGHVHRIDGDYLGVCDSCSAYEFNCAKHEIEKLKNENESLKKDAARYRYVRNCLHRETDILVTSKKAAHVYGDLGVYSCSVLDEIIDEAIIKEDNK